MGLFGTRSQTKRSRAADADARVDAVQTLKIEHAAKLAAIKSEAWNREAALRAELKQKTAECDALRAQNKKLQAANLSPAATIAGTSEQQQTSSEVSISPPPRNIADELDAAAASSAVDAAPLPAASRGAPLSMRLDDAAPLFRKDLYECRGRFGNRHPSTLIAMFNLAGHLKVQGDMHAALELYAEAARMGQETKHPHFDMFKQELTRLELEMALAA